LLKLFEIIMKKVIFKPFHKEKHPYIDLSLIKITKTLPERRIFTYPNMGKEKNIFAKGKGVWNLLINGD